MTELRAAETGAAPDVVDRIQQKTRGRLRSYLSSREDWNQSRSLKNLTEHAVRDYEHRALVELLQNAHDAQAPGDRAGRVLFRLDEDEGGHGVLYVANSGRGLSDSNFDAITDVARSDKLPEEGIGNKGIGFKSVLQLSRSPEVYSLRHEARATDDLGYCFGFAGGPDIAEALARLGYGPDVVGGLTGEVIADVFPLCLPAPRPDQPATVTDLFDSGYVTVVRLPLASSEAADDARAQLEQLTDGPPVLLFLRRISELVVETTADGVQTASVLLRSETAQSRVGPATVARVELGSGGTWALAEQPVPQDSFREAVDRSIAGGHISAGWRDWTGEVRVALALRLDEELSVGRLYTFLPMGAEATAPLAAHVNAPFFARLARVDLETSVPLNDLLLDHVAELAAGLLLAAPAGEVPLPPESLVDLLSWDAPEHARLSHAFERLGSEAATAKVLPQQGAAGAWGSLATSSLWTDGHLSVLTGRALVEQAGAGLVIPLSSHRAARLAEAARVLAHHDLTPRPDLVADWAEDMAGSLARREAAPETWGRFYDELAVVVRDRAALRGRKILIDDHGSLRRCNGAADSRQRPIAFFSPRATSDEGGRAEDIRLPERLRRSVFFVSQAVDWNPRSGSVASKRPGRALLEDGLVHEYRADALLPVIAEVLHRRQQAVAQDVLLWTFRFATTRDEVPWREIVKMRLLVPVRDGSWLPAEEALLSAEWGGRDVALLEDLLSRTAGISQELESLAGSMVAPPNDPRFGLLAADDLRSFLVEIGVRSGLVPTPTALTFRIEGRLVVDAEALGAAGLSAATSARLASAVRQPPVAARPYTSYIATAPLHRLPGQDDYERFPPPARQTYAALIVSGLANWPEEAFQVPMAKLADRREVFRLPSPLRAFLTEASWVPVSSPGSRTEIEFVPCRNAWSQSEDAPPFLPVAARDVRRALHASPSAERRAQQLGLRLWDSPATASDRIRLLAELWEAGAVSDTVVHNFRSAYEDAWTALVGSASLTWPFDGTDRAPLVVSRGTRVEVLDLLLPAGEVVYVQDGDVRQTVQLLDQSGALTMRVRGSRAGQVATRLQEAFPARVRRLSELQVTVSVDSRPFRPGADWPLLIGTDQSWFVDLVAAIVELRGSTFRRTSPEALRRVTARLRRIRLVRVGNLRTQIDGRDVDTAGDAGSRAVQDEEYPAVLLTDDGAAQAPDLERATGPLSELIGHPELAAQLRLALIDLRMRGFGAEQPPGPDVLAAVLSEPVERLNEVRSFLRQPDDLAQSVLIPLVAIFDVERARVLEAGDEDAPPPAELAAWLAERVGTPDVVPRLTAAAGDGDLDLARRVLQVRLSEVNAAIRELGSPYQVLRDEEAIEQQFRAFRARCEERVLHALRVEHLGAFRRGGPLDGYLAARTLDGLTVGPTWADEYYTEVPESLLQARVDEWLGLHCLGHDHGPVELQPLGPLRADNRKRVLEWAEVAHRVVRAQAEGATSLEKWPSEADLADRIGRSGVLDFEPLEVDRFLKWLADAGLWPPGLALTLDAEQLGLSDDVLRRAEQTATRERQARQEARQRVVVDGRDVLATETHYAELWDLVLAGIDDDFRRSTGAVDLRPVSGGRGTRAPGPGRPGTTAARQPRLSDVQAAAVGLAGEIAALEWVKARHPGVEDLEIWKSGYRNLLIGDGGGDDTLGFDIRVDDSRVSWLYEVKASAGLAGDFLLTGSEIARAQGLKRRERYHVLYVEHALDSDLRRIYKLPNPVDPRNARLYRTVGDGVRYSFQLDERP